MSIIEAELEEMEPPLQPPSIRVRLAGPRDCAALCDLLDNPAGAREQVLTWLESPGTTLLVAQSELGILGVAVLITRIVPLPGAGAHKVVEVDNLVVRADLRGRRIGRRLLAALPAMRVVADAGEWDALIDDLTRASTTGSPPS